MSTALIPLGHRDLPPVESTADLLNRVDDGIMRVKRWGYAVSAVFFLGFGGWAYFAPLKAGAYATGQIAVQTGRKTLQHYEGGILAEFLVKEGDVVQPGQPIARMRDEQQRAGYEITLQKARDLYAMVARLSAERDEAKEIVWPEFLTKSQDDPAVVAVMRGQQNVFDARRKSFADQIDLLSQRITQQEESIRGAEAQIRSRRGQMGLLDEEINTVRELLTSGNAIKPRLLALQRSRSDVEANIVGLQSSILQTKEQINQLRSQIVGLRSDRFTQVMSDLKQAQIDLSDTQQRLVVASDQLERTIVRAPTEGMIANKRFFTNGAVVRQGEPMVDLVPLHETLIVDAHISAEDVDVVHAGMTATVRFPSLPRKTTPPVDGQVTYIAPDAAIDQRTGMNYYQLKVMVPPEQLALVKHELVPGMPASVMVEKGERSMLEYLLGPIGQAWERSMRED